MSWQRTNPLLRERGNADAGFTLVELITIIAIVGLVILLHLPALSRVNRATKVAQCSSNLRQFALAHQVYAYEFNDKLPLGAAGGWAWDMQWNAGLLLNRYGASEEVMYCPGTGPRFTDDDNEALYEYYAPGSIHVIGYAHTLPNSGGVGNVLATNLNFTLTPQTIVAGPLRLPPPIPAQRVLAADATLQVPNGSYTDIAGGYQKHHTSPHLIGSLPVGGNLGMLDGHVEWRRFQAMQIRNNPGVVPAFWW
jgi:prepilin-type processing-associated H-X9-DG protein